MAVAASHYQCSTHSILLGLLTAVSVVISSDSQMQEEVPSPLYYSFHGVTSSLRLTAPKYQEIASALRHAGYTQSQCHCDPLALKTNAPGSVVFDIFRAYFRQFQMEEKKDWLEQLPGLFCKTVSVATCRR